MCIKLCLLVFEFIFYSLHPLIQVVPANKIKIDNESANVVLILYKYIHITYMCVRTTKVFLTMLNIDSFGSTPSMSLAYTMHMMSRLVITGRGHVSTQEQQATTTKYIPTWFLDHYSQLNMFITNGGLSKLF